MLNKIMVFRSDKHFSDYVLEKKFPGKHTNELGIPLIFEIPGKNLDWVFYKNKVLEYYNFNDVKCPLCYWNRTGLVYLQPWVEYKKVALKDGSEKKIPIVHEKFGKCPHRFDGNFVESQGNGSDVVVANASEKKETEKLPF